MHQPGHDTTAGHDKNAGRHRKIGHGRKVGPDRKVGHGTDEGRLLGESAGGPLGGRPIEDRVALERRDEVGDVGPAWRGAVPLVEEPADVTAEAGRP